MARSHHSVLVHRHKQRKGKGGLKRVQPLDNIMLATAFIYPLAGLPQVIAVWSGGEVAVLTWILFLMFDLLSLTYGIVHRIWPLVVSGILWAVVELAVIIGVLRN